MSRHNNTIRVPSKNREKKSNEAYYITIGCENAVHKILENHKIYINNLS